MVCRATVPAYRRDDRIINTTPIGMMTREFAVKVISRIRRCTA